MAAALHFAFELFKIAILSLLYSPITLAIVYAIIKICRTPQLNLRQMFKYAYELAYLALFVFSFTYYGNHGLGDDSYLPIGNGATVHQSDETMYFDDGHGDLHINKFIVKNETLYAETDTDYLVCALSNKNLSHISLKNYSNSPAQSEIPSPNAMESFNVQYDRYWSGWRFWLLP